MKIVYLSVITALMYLFCYQSATAQCGGNPLCSDSLVLVAIYQATNGTYWSNNANWLSSAPLSQWYGITTQKVNGKWRVTEINLPDNNLRGSLPASISNLTAIQILNLEQNRINNLPALFPAWNPPLPDVNLNENNLDYNDVLSNINVLSDARKYAIQYADTTRQYTKEGANKLLFFYGSRFGIDHPAEDSSFVWRFNGVQIGGATSPLYLVMNSDVNDAGFYTRITSYPFSAIPALRIYNTAKLIVYKEDAAGGKFNARQLIIRYADTTSQSTIALYEAELEAIGAEKVKECSCKENLQLWEATGVDLESVGSKAKTQTGVDTTEYNYITDFQPPRIPTNFPVNGSLLLADATLTDNSYLSYNPLNPQQEILATVIDSGVDTDHPMTTGQLWNNPAPDDPMRCKQGDLVGYDFRDDLPSPEDYTDHGTGVNGVLGRNFPAAYLDMMNAKFYDENQGELFDAVCASWYAIEEGTKVLNNSWGYISDTASAVLYEALEAARDAGILVVTSAGNTSDNNDVVGKWPANFAHELDNIIVVASYHLHENGIQIDTLFPDYSNFGPNSVHLAAPGHAVAPVNDGGADAVFGTSIATPFVTRTAAAIWSMYPQLTYAGVKAAILNSVRTVQGFDAYVSTGGILDFNAALDAAAALPLEWLTVKGIRTGKGIKIQWFTQQEEQVEQFSVRRSADGKIWKSLATVSANNQQYNSYKWLDEQPLEGINYYQIQQTDWDGKQSLSPIISVNYAPPKNKKINLYPNPVSGSELTVSSEEALKAVTIFDLTGKAQLHQAVHEAVSQLNVHLPPLPAGLYAVKIVTERATVTKSLYIEE